MSETTRILLTELYDAKISLFGARPIALRPTKLRLDCGKSIKFIQM